MSPRVSELLSGHILKFTKGYNSIKNVGRVTVLVLCITHDNEHSGGCRRQPSTPAEGGRRAKLVCRYRVYHLQ